MFNTIVGAGTVGAVSRYGSGSEQLMRLLAASQQMYSVFFWDFKTALAKVQNLKNCLFLKFMQRIRLQSKTGKLTSIRIGPPYWYVSVSLDFCQPSW
jgi:hypothetical protein